MSTKAADPLIPDPSGVNRCENPTANPNCGDYTLNDFVALGVNVSKIILGIVGSLSLLMFIYGGISFLVSAGSPDQISKAKKIIIAAVIGLAIVFTSYLIIGFIMTGLGYQNSWNVAPQ